MVWFYVQFALKRESSLSLFSFALILLVKIGGNWKRVDLILEADFGFEGLMFVMIW